MARDPRLDAAKGVLIALVVLGHVLEVAAPAGDPAFRAGWSSAPQTWLLSGIYAFHMPLFVLLAGITAKAAGRGRRALQLLVILVPVQLLLVLPRVLAGQTGPESLLGPAFALWFLAALAVWLLLTPLIDRLPRTSIAVAAALAVAAAVVPGDPNLLAWSRTLFFLPFFVVGHVAGWRLIRIWRAGPRAATGAAVALVGCATLAVLLPLHPLWVMGNGTAQLTALPPGAAMAARAAAVVLTAAAAGAALLLLPTSGRVLELLGRRSLGIYVAHQLVVQPLDAVLFPAGVPWPVFIAGALLLTALLLAVCSLPVIDRSIRVWSDAAARRLLHPLTHPTRA